MDDSVILRVSNLRVGFETEDHGMLVAVDGISFDLKASETLGLVGESGCGKSVTALSLLRLLPQPLGKILSGEILIRTKVGWEDIVGLHPSQLSRIRGARISMIFQEPMTALNPVHTIGRQIFESFRLHFPKMSDGEILTKSIKILDDVGIPSPEKRIHEFPHQLSGGMRQRVLIAIALSADPEILIADEPTTALDVTIQAQILDLMANLQKERGMGILLITHDLGVVAQMCQRTLVMYAGRVAEGQRTKGLFDDPRHPYTKGLLSSIPRLGSQRKTQLPTIEGSVPALKDLKVGCRFQSRCPLVTEKCKTEIPPALARGDQTLACWNRGFHD
jgi:oligopeptide/dipeptide ABC transporter ATP-binding protein